MLMYSCRCILFIVVTGFYPNAKRFKNHLKMELENQIKKKRDPFSFSLFPAQLGFSFSLSRPARARPFPPLFSSWAGPVWLSNRAALSLLSAADGPGPHVGAIFFPQPSPPLARLVLEQPARAHTPGHGSAHHRSPASL
jgi:hypothetical protein